MEYDPLKLENQLCFPLYASAKEVVRIYRPHLDKIGLTYTQYIAMMVLWEHKSINIKSLGERLFLDSGTLTPLLKRMESQGLVVRKRDIHDERNVIVAITNKGEELKKQAVDIPAKIVSCLPIDKEDQKELYQLLYKILNNM